MFARLTEGAEPSMRLLRATRRTPFEFVFFPRQPPGTPFLLMHVASSCWVSGPTDIPSFLVIAGAVELATPLVRDRVVGQTPAASLLLAGRRVLAPYVRRFGNEPIRVSPRRA